MTLTGPNPVGGIMTDDKRFVPNEDEWKPCKVKLIKVENMEISLDDDEEYRKKIDELTEAKRKSWHEAKDIVLD